jgi:UDP-galactopyranose mutase
MAIPPGEARSFADYVRRSFGGGIARHFLTPYNQKLWGVEDLADLTASWVGGKVILPELQDVLDGAIRDRRYGKLPNAVIRYPRHGGIETLARGVAARVLHLSLSTKLESVDVRGRVARTSTGREIAYDALVWTLPLAALPAVVPALPGEVRSAVLALRFRDVIAVHLGIGRERVVPWHWMYYPEPRHPFYRVSFPSNLAPSTVPAGCSSVIAEVAVPPGEPVDEPALAARCVDALVESGILRCDDEIRFQAAWRVSPAYVVYDHSREAAVRVIHDFLRGHRILPAGRFGEWRFFNMDHTVLSGMQAAAAAASLLHG